MTQAETSSSHNLTRRQMLRNASLAGIGLCLSGGRAFAGGSPNEKLNIAFVGLGNQGGDNLSKMLAENVVALCDVDTRRSGIFAKKLPKARQFQDFRVMLDKMDKEIDAVVVTTPNHAHALVTATAMRRGKHVYCEKPLTHTIDETRMLMKLAEETSLVTQMGTQIHAGDNYRRCVELIEAGAIGDVEEVYIWLAGKPTGMRRHKVLTDRPTDSPPVPKELDWDLWTGPAPMRPYHPCYHPHDWHYWWDFGNGEMGNMACHFMDLVFWALDLDYPRRIEAKGTPVHPESTPLWIDSQWDFAAKGKRPPVRVHWTNGHGHPKRLAELKVPKWSSGILFIGKDGMLLTDYNRHTLLPESKFADFKPPEPTIPSSIGHRKEWIAACKGAASTNCPFRYSGLVTETVLLGNIAYRMGKPVEWDAEAMRFPNDPEAERYLKASYRQGWDI